MATLETPSRLRELQRALYLRAKKDAKFRFYSLYDKVYRKDVLEHAYALCRMNGGAPGVDGRTFDDIERDGRNELLEELANELRKKEYRPGPVRRVYIPKANGGERPLGIPNIRDRVVQAAAKLLLEPIFEADFDRDSYGFRPERNAHQALEAIREALKQGMAWVIDADVQAYFDTIPHDRLMKTVAERVVDGAMLALVKMFLEAPVVDERDGGRPRKPEAGTPQGGVISPLLANIYLNLLDRNVRRKVEEGWLHGRVVRYADDFVWLTRRRPDAELSWLHRLMERLGLKLHPEKTRVLRAGKEDFDFLGHRIRYSKGRVYFDISVKARRRIHDALRELTRRTWSDLGYLIERMLNPYIRGARGYFCKVRGRTLAKLDWFVEQRIARWDARKRNRRLPSWSLVTRGRLWREEGLQRWNPPKELRTAPSR